MEHFEADITCRRVAECRVLGVLRDVGAHVRPAPRFTKRALIEVGDPRGPADTGALEDAVAHGPARVVEYDLARNFTELGKTNRVLRTHREALLEPPAQIEMTSGHTAAGEPHPGTFEADPVVVDGERDI